MTGPVDQPGVSTTRGTSIQLLEPVGAVNALHTLSWRTAFPFEMRYRVEIELGDDTLWQIETAATSLPAPPELLDMLEAGGQYRWRVLGFDDEAALAASDWATFSLAP